MKLKRLLTFLLSTLYFLLFSSPVHAQVDISKWYAFGDLDNLGEGVDRLVLPAFSIAMVGVTFYFIFGAFKYITSSGNKEDVGKAQGMMTHAIIGFILLMFSFVVFQFILSSLLGVKDLPLIGT